MIAALIIKISTIRKSVIVKEVYDNATYALTKLDGSKLRVLVAGKRVKLFKQRGKDCIKGLSNSYLTAYIHSSFLSIFLASLPLSSCFP
jgi:hypothetical protein